MERAIRARRYRGRLRSKNKRLLLRVSIFRSNRRVSVQLVDDRVSQTLAAFNDLNLKGTMISRGEQVGRMLGKRLVELGINEVILDKSWYKYHGVVKALTEGFRLKIDQGMSKCDKANNVNS